MNHIKLFKLITLLLVLSCLSSCGLKQSMGIPERGKYCGNRYFDQHGWFSVDIPNHYKSKIQEPIIEDESIVIFHGNFGDLIQFQVCQFPDDLFNILSAIEKEFGSREDYLKHLFHKCDYIRIASQFPGTTTAHEQIVDLGNDGKGYYIVLKIPGGSKLINTNTSKAVQAIRGSLVFISKKQLVVMSIQCPSLLEDDEELKIQAKRRLPIWMLDELLYTKEGYRNEHNKELSENSKGL